MILENIESPEDLKKLKSRELKTLASEMRKRIINVASRTGGHVAPNLGTVELTIALLSVFEPPRDKLIWDVSHQAYGYKLLTGRNKVFDTLRQFGGISGFLNRDESIYDAFGAGHSSTSLSAALGFAVARDLREDNYEVVAIIGDGALTGGMAMEGLNQIGYLNNDLLIILNDNRMSIAKNVGGMTEYLTRLQSAEIYNRIKDDAWDLIDKIPEALSMKAKNAAKKLSEGLKNLIVPNILFEELGLTYFGPIDGHDIEELITILSRIKKIKGAKILHVITEKGKGYKPAEDKPTMFHGLGPFNQESGKKIKKGGPKKYSQIFGETMVEEAKENQDIIGITAAMPSGTGLEAFKKKFPERSFDVGIAEQHAVTFAGGLAAGGKRPVCAIYSTFLQRAIDQVIHDIALQKLPVIFCLDRAGLVGGDGATHHGAFDLTYLRMIPNLVVMAPRDEIEFKRMFKTALNYTDGPIAMRYPRGTCEGLEIPENIDSLDIGKGEVMKKGENLLILTVGPVVYRVLEISEKLDNINPTVVDAKFIKPLDEELILNLIESRDKIVTIEDNAITGGFGSGVMELLQQNNIKKDVLRIGIPDRFIPHGKQSRLHSSIGMGPEELKKRIREFMK